MKRFLTTLIGVLGVLALLIGLNMIANPILAGQQIDLTQQQLFTLSPGTRSVLAGLKEKITLRLFYSPEIGARIPQYGVHADRVRELLREYAALAPGKIALEFHNPEPFTDDEDRATAYGLQPVPLDQSGEKVFFGLQGTNLLDDERAIPFFQPERERFLEYDLTRLVQDLSSPNKPVVGVMSPLKLEGDPQRMMAKQGGAPWAVMLSLNQSNIVRDIPLDATAIAPDVKVLLLVHPQNLSDATLYAIDQFVLRGGKLMAMVGPGNEALQPETPSDLKRLFDAWGVIYDPDQVVGDLEGAWKVRGNRDEPVEYVGYFSVRDGINHDDPATAELQEIVLANPGYFDFKPTDGLNVTPLLTTSAHSAPIPAADIRGDPDPAHLLENFHPDGERRIVAARLSGILHSAFDKAPEGAAEPFLAQSSGPANIVLIADTDMLADRFWTRPQEFFGADNSAPFADNGALISNLVGSLTGGDALIGLRARGGISRPFEVVDALQRNAEARYRETETELSKHLGDTSKTLDDLRGGRDGTQNAALNAEQLTLVDSLKADIVATRGKLRQVQFELRRDIARLQTQIRLLDIAAVPALLLLVAGVMAWIRRARRTRRPA